MVSILQSMQTSSQLAIGITSDDEFEHVTEILNFEPGLTTVVTFSGSIDFVPLTVSINPPGDISEVRLRYFNVLSHTANSVTIDFDSTNITSFTSGSIALYTNIGTAQTQIRNRCTALQKILGSEMAILADRKLWSVRSFEQFDYCISNNGLYICITNKTNSSVIQPIHLTVGESLLYKDGYTWLYAGRINPVQDQTFGDADKFPVVGFPLVSTKGQILGCQVLEAGSNYGILDRIQIVGDGFGAIAKISQYTTTRGVFKVEILNPGRDYSWASIRIPSTVGAGFEAELVIDNGDIGSNLPRYTKANTLGIRCSLDPEFGQFGDVISTFVYHSRFLEEQQDLRGEIIFTDVHEFELGSLVIGEISGTITKVLEISQRSLKYMRISGPGFVEGEVVSGRNWSSSIQSVQAPQEIPVGEIFMSRNHVPPITRESGLTTIQSFRLEFK